MKVPKHPTIDIEGWQVSLGGMLIPTDKCLTRVVKVTAGAKLDVKEGPGVNGASVTFQGTKLVKFGLEFKSGWRRTGDEAEGLVLLWQLADAAVKAKSAGKWLEVDHPILTLHGVSRLLVEAIEGPTYDDGCLRFALDAIQWAPPKKAASVTATPGHGGKGLGVADVFLPQDLDAGAMTRPKPPSQAFKPSLKKA